MRAPSLLLLVPLLLVALAPIAAADHVYSHRYLVLGRVVDADGSPVPNVTVSLTLRDLQTEGPCSNQPGTETDAFGRTQDRPVTNAFGEFTFCRHVHAMSRALPGTAALRVEAANVTQEVALDPDFRASFLVLRLPAASPQADPGALVGTYTVAGRAWQPAPGGATVEGIRVFGATLNRVPVNLTLAYDGKTVRANATTNNYGDFAVRVPVDGRAAQGRVTVEVLGQVHEANLTAEGVTYVKAAHQAPSPAAPTPATPTGAAPTPAPTTGGQNASGAPSPAGPTRNAPLPLAPVLGGILVAALVARRRRA